MAIHSIVLEKPLGSQAEGDVIQVDEEVAQSLISAGVAREATSEDLGQGEEETPEEITDDVDPAGIVTDSVKHVEETVTKAATKAAEKLIANQVKRPNFGPQNRHVAGSDYGETGGFKSLGDFAHTVMAKDNGNFSAMSRLNKSRAVVEKNLRTKAPMSISGSSGHVGGDLVPQQWAQELWKLSFDKVPDLHGMCSQYPMENQVLNIPSWVQASASSAIQANVIAENTDITETSGVTATVQLSLVKFAVLVNTTDELERFNSYALDSVLKQVAPQRIRYLVNDSIVNGTNSQVNLVGNAATVVVTRETANRINFNDVTKMEAALLSDFVDDAVWLINNSTSPELYSLSFPNRSASTPFPAFTAGGFGNLLGPKPVGELLGKPVYRLENVPALGSKGDIILYSPKSIAGASTGLIADSTPFLYFQKAVNTYRFLWYADTVNPLTTAYTRKDGSTASNIVVLSASSSS